MATVRVRGDGLERLADVIGVGASREAIAAATGPDELGWTTLSIMLEDLWHAEAQLLHLGPNAEVVEPAELRERVAAASRATAALYR